MLMRYKLLPGVTPWGEGLDHSLEKRVYAEILGLEWIHQPLTACPKNKYSKKKLGLEYDGLAQEARILEVAARCSHGWPCKRTWLGGNGTAITGERFRPTPPQSSTFYPQGPARRSLPQIETETCLRVTEQVSRTELPTKQGGQDKWVFDILPTTAREGRE